MNDASVIGSGTVVRGNLRGAGSLEILGRIDGDISVTGDVLLGESGAVRGNISAAKITVLGAVQGDLHGTVAVLLEHGARVAGDLVAPRIGIANGALVRGAVRTEGEPALTPGRRHASAGASRPQRAAPVALATAAKPVAKAEPRPAPAPQLPPAEDSEPPEAAPKAREAARRPPPPVVPSLGKGAKAKKKKSRES